MPHKLACLYRNSNMNPNSSAGNSYITLLAPPVIYLSIQKGQIFGKEPPLQILAADKCPMLNAVLSAVDTVLKDGSYPVLFVSGKRMCLINVSSIRKTKKTNKENKATNIN